MKNIFLTCVSLALLSTGMAQLKPKLSCPDFEVDVLDGKVNGIKADYPNDRIKNQLPCFSSSVEGKDSSKCGTSVFYKDRDIYFYTERDYIEIGPKFKGKLSVPLMGAQRKNLFNWLANPKMKDDKWEAYQTNYGILVLHFDASNKVNLIQMSTQSTETLILC